MCVQPAAVVQGDADQQPDPEYLVPALLEAARQPQVLKALSHLYDGTGDNSIVSGMHSGCVWLSTRGSREGLNVQVLLSPWARCHQQPHCL